MEKESVMMTMDEEERSLTTSKILNTTTTGTKIIPYLQNSFYIE